MDLAIYFKKFQGKGVTPKIVPVTSEYDGADVSALRSDLPANLKVSSAETIAKVKSALLRANGGEDLVFKSVYLEGVNTIKWEFARSNRVMIDVEF